MPMYSHLRNNGKGWVWRDSGRVNRWRCWGSDALDGAQKLGALSSYLALRNAPLWLFLSYILLQ